MFFDKDKYPLLYFYQVVFGDAGGPTVSIEPSEQDFGHVLTWPIGAGHYQLCWGNLVIDWQGFE